jgi:peptide/nickel transport system permease protein
LVAAEIVRIKSRAQLWRSFLSPILGKKTAKAGMVIIAFFVGLMFIGPYFVPYSPYASTGAPNSPPSFSHVFGTDFQGRDVLSEVISGAYSSMAVGFAGGSGAVILGLLMGVIAGYFSRLEGLLTGLADVILTFPALPLMVLLGSLYPPTDVLITGIMVIVLWPAIARSIRSQVLSLKKMPFVDAARTSGMGNWRIIWNIIIPEVIPIAIAYFVLTVAAAIVLISALQFLGIGNPEVVSWGSMLYWAQQFAFYNGDWWWIAAPGIAITVVATGFAMIGFSFEEISNPRLRV